MVQDLDSLEDAAPQLLGLPQRGDAGLQVVALLLHPGQQRLQQYTSLHFGLSLLCTWNLAWNMRELRSC